MPGQTQTIVVSVQSLGDLFRHGANFLPGRRETVNIEHAERGALGAGFGREDNLFFSAVDDLLDRRLVLDQGRA